MKSDLLAELTDVMSDGVSQDLRILSIGIDNNPWVQYQPLIPSVLLHSCISFVYFLNTISFSEDGKESLWLSFISKFRALSTHLKPLRYLYPCGGLPSTS